MKSKERHLATFDGIADPAGDERILSLVTSALFTNENQFSNEDFLLKILGGVRDERSLSLMMRALEHKNWHVRTRAVKILGLLDRKESIASVRKSVTHDEDEEVRRAAAVVLVQLAGKDALPDLLLALDDDDDWVREDAARLLGQLGDPKAIPKLNATLSDEVEYVRDAAKEALNKLAAR